MLLNRTILSLPASPLRYIEDAGDYSVYRDPWGDDWHLQHGTGRILVDFDSLDIRDLWEEFEASISPFATNLSINTKQRRFIGYLADRTYEPENLDQIEFCADCHEPELEDVLESTNSMHNSVCESCIEEYYWCNDCEERFRQIVCVLDDGQRDVCEGCRNEHYSYCDDCEYYYADVDSHEHDHEDEDEEDNEDDGCCESPAQTFTIRNDGDEPLRNDRQVTVTLPAGQISDEGMGQIANLLRNHGQSLIQDIMTAYHRGEIEYHAYFEQVNPVISPWNALSYELTDTVGSKWQASEGNFTKRLGKVAYKQHGLKIPPAVISQIGNIASDHSRAIDHKLAVTRNLNLPARDFAHGGSCWWSCYSASRCALKSNGGFGLRTFDEHDNVIGRAWVMPLRLTPTTWAPNGILKPTFDTEEPDAFMMFNGYGNLGGYTGPRILAHMVGMTYRKVEFQCQPMYVNGESGYLIGAEETVAPYTDGSLTIDDVQAHSSLYRTEQRQAAVAAAAATTEELAHV